MKAALRLAAVLAVVAVFSAWVSPVLFRFLPFEYERILNRLMAVLSVAAVYFLYIRGREKESALFGLTGRGKWRWFGCGLVYGAATLALIIVIEIALGARRWSLNPSPHGFLYSVAKALSTGVAVGIFEEWFFRGFLLRSFRRALSLGSSIFWMNIVYAISHFIEVGNLRDGAQASFVNSLRLILDMFSQLWLPSLPVVFGLIGLFIFGYLLTWSFLKTGSLYLSMGIHAGIVTALKFHGRMIQPAGSAPFWVFGDQKYYNGVLGWVCLLASWAILAWLIPRLPWPKNDLVFPASYQKSSASGS